MSKRIVLSVSQRLWINDASKRSQSHPPFGFTLGDVLSWKIPRRSFGDIFLTVNVSALALFAGFGERCKVSNHACMHARHRYRRELSLCDISGKLDMTVSSSEVFRISCRQFNTRMTSWQNARAKSPLMETVLDGFQSLFVEFHSPVWTSATS